ncbi:hypothetical protein DKM44_13595 [Deinococcus irradiatisoli]|uniref:Transposase Helix-turn-helix domain-containing protein n=2 Tax=Deinococcus irradiatisoli TaxID=2202254 RepID=A0A2Z3JKQ8_9DEIO|nr:hypothetical protein DKM44_13595 [Deinococcus irradiatisoli]
MIPAVLRRPHAAPQQFQALTGLSPAEFEALVRRTAPLYRLSEVQRLGQRSRRRAPGAGRKFEHPFAERLAVQLILRHARPTQKLLSRITGFTESTLSRDARRLAPVLPPLPGAEGARPPLRSARELLGLLTPLPEVS